jgi:maleate isomerase
MMNRPFRIGQIIPKSNLTKETEIPALLRARNDFLPNASRFSREDAGF